MLRRMDSHDNFIWHENNLNDWGPPLPPPPPQKKKRKKKRKKHTVCNVHIADDCMLFLDLDVHYVCNIVLVQRF